MLGTFSRFFRPKCVPEINIQFPNYAEYGRNYEKLAIALGRPGRTPDEDELHLIRRLIKERPARAGSLTLADALFLAGVTSILAPERVIEVGTGTGFSSALIAAVLCRLGSPPVTARVQTIDAHTCYRCDKSIPIGGDIAALIPEFASAVQVHAPYQSEFADQLAKSNELELGFIDADHQHPCPLLDLLRLARVLRPGGWIVLHDIALGTLALAAKRRGDPLPFPGQFGAEWLFQKWPFRKIAGGNIGAIQLPNSKRHIRRIVRSLMKLPFEIASQGHRRLRREIAEASRALAAGRTDKLPLKSCHPERSAAKSEDPAELP
jgi:predicted O-methyltransferase YrrM